MRAKHKIIRLKEIEHNDIHTNETQKKQGWTNGESES